MGDNPLNRFSKLSPVGFAEESLAILFSIDDWPQQVLAWLETTPDEALLKLAAEVFTPPDVQPRFLPLLAWEHGCVVINHFDRAAFDRMAEVGKQAPHYHHFDFATRVIRGNYTQWLFTNHGTLTQPDLQFRRQVRCDTGDGYFIRHDVYHHVFPPENDTISLMVRSRRRVEEPRHQGICREAGDVLAFRSHLVDLLAVSGPTQAGHVQDLAA
jgi:hypothetical protein